MNAIERGKKFLVETVGWSPEQVAALDEAKLTAVGESVLRQEDYSKNMTEVQTARNAVAGWREELAKWEASKKQELAEGAAARDRLAKLEATGGHMLGADGKPTGGTGNGAAAPDLAGFVRKEDVDALVGKARSDGFSYTTHYAAYMAGLVAQHREEFGEVLDTNKLLTFCRERNIQIDRGGYDAFVGERREEKRTKDIEARIKEAEERGFRRGMTEATTDLPFPTGPGSIGGEHVTLSGLDPKLDKTQAVARAVQTWNEETRKRAAGS